MSLKIVLLSQSHLCRNPRLLKEARLLSDAGHTVYILNTINSQNLLQQDMELLANYPTIKYEPVINLITKKFTSIAARLWYKIGSGLIYYFKIETPFALGYGTLAYIKKCKTLRADLYICHQELATYVGGELIKSGYKAAFDFEDWYAEDLLPKARRSRPINLLKQVERYALQNGSFCVTTSNAMAQQMALTYNCAPPNVVYNVFPAKPALHQKPKAFNQPLKLFWFSQTIGHGRGLEEFINLLTSIKTSVELHLLGNIDSKYRAALITSMPAQHQIFFHELVNDKDLAQKIANFDIGLALERTTPLSRNLTITNKLFQYLQAGLPVIATDTEGQREVFDNFNIGFMLPQDAAPGDKKSLAAWLNDSVALKQSREIVKKAAEFYSWENESKKFPSLINKANE